MSITRAHLEKSWEFLVFLLAVLTVQQRPLIPCLCREKLELDWSWQVAAAPFRAHL